MADPWLTIVGLGENGLPGLAPASRDALAAAEAVFGGPRHLALAEAGARGHPWPMPFSVDPVIAMRGRRVVVLASGDPFWFGAGGSLVPHLEPGEWVSHPAPSTFALAANALGWRLEETGCFGLHAAAFDTLRGEVRDERRLVCLLRDGAAVGAFAAWLTAEGAGGSVLHVLERLGGPSARRRTARARGFALDDIAAPVAVAVQVSASAAGPPAGGAPPAATGAGRDGPPRPADGPSGRPVSEGPLPRTPGLPDDRFAHAGQITKQAVRALTLCALAPREGEMLWDLGAGSGSIAVEWALLGGRAWAVEARADRTALIRENVRRFGLGPLVEVLEARLGATLPDALLAVRPDAVFVGGGADADLLGALHRHLAQGTRLVANAVTLETEALLVDWHGRLGGDLVRIDLARASPLGQGRGWTPARSVVQWSVRL